MILDASALLAYLHQEPGADSVRPFISIAGISTVNWSEVAQKLRSKAVDDQAVAKLLVEMGLRFIPFSYEHASKAGELWLTTASFGLSLGDRACLAVALCENQVVITADSIWQKLPLELEIRLIR